MGDPNAFSLAQQSLQQHAPSSVPAYDARRGMQTSSYVKMAPGVTVDDLRAHLAKVYADEFFVKVGT